MPFPVKAIQVDGGAEFEAILEEKYQRRDIKLFVLPPRSPKLNKTSKRGRYKFVEWRQFMAKALVVYDSVTGNTEKMAKAIGDGIRESGLNVEVKKVDDTTLDDLVGADAIAMGSPTHFSTMSAKMKTLIDKSIEIWPNEPGKLRDKIGAAFTACGGADGGNETTLLSLIRAMLWHGMVIVGHQSGSCGAISVGAPDEKCIAGCRQFGKRVGSLVKR